MKKALIIALILALILSIGAPAFAFSAQLSAQNLSVDGQTVACEKYNIDGSNYFKLRDLAKLLDGTGSQFDVGWDGDAGVVSITTGHAYTTPNGTELVVGADQSVTAQLSAQTIMIDGAVRTDLTVYNIGGSNFFKLREMGDALGFAVDYDSATNTAAVTSQTAAPAEEITISLDVISLALKVGETKQLTATVTPEGTPVTWSSGNDAIATVDANGLVTAVGAGKADIFAVAGNNKAFCTVTVSEIPVYDYLIDFVLKNGKQKGSVYTYTLYENVDSFYANEFQYVYLHYDKDKQELRFEELMRYVDTDTFCMIETENGSELTYLWTETSASLICPKNFSDYSQYSISRTSYTPPYTENITKYGARKDWDVSKIITAGSNYDVEITNSDDDYTSVIAGMKIGAMLKETKIKTIKIELSHISIAFSNNYGTIFAGNAWSKYQKDIPEFFTFFKNNKVW